MRERDREKLVRALIAFAASTVVVPAGLAALGISWLTIFAVSLFVTVGIAVVGFPARRIISVPVLVASGALAVWAVKQEEFYSPPFETCTSEGYWDTGSEYQLKVLNVGIRLINSSGHDLWAKVDEQSFSLGSKSDDRPFSQHVMPIANGNGNYVVTNGLMYDPPIDLRTIPEGRIRYVLWYGRKADQLPKKLTFSGKVTIGFLQDGKTFLNFEPDRDSDTPINMTRNCRLPSPVLPHPSA